MRSATSASISSWTSQRTDSRRKSVPGSSALRKSPNNAILSSATVCLLSGCWSDNLHGKPTVASSSRPAFYTTPRDSIVSSNLADLYTAADDGWLRNETVGVYYEFHEEAHMVDSFLHGH